MGSRDTGRSSPFGGARLLPVKNDAGEAIPMGGVVWVNGKTTLSDQTVLSAVGADSDSHPWFVAQSAIGDGKRGVVSCDWPQWVLYDTGETVPAVGDEIGPTSTSSFLTRPAGDGLIALTAGEDGWVLVTAAGVPGPAGDTTLFAEFTLTAALSSGSSSGATVDAFWGGADPGATIDVLDPIGKFKGGIVGSKGIATYNADDSEWVVLECTTKASRIRFELTATLTSAASATASVKQFWDGDDPDPAPAGITVYNLVDEDGGYLLDGIAGQTGTAHYDPLTDKYWIESLKCTA